MRNLIALAGRKRCRESPGLRLDLEIFKKVPQERELIVNYQAIIYDVKNHIGYVTLNRPEVMNAVNQQMRREIIDVCEQVRRDPEVRVCIFTGAGDRAFSTGFDLKERAPQSRRTEFLRAATRTAPARYPFSSSSNLSD